jgi:hypothetical protein
MSKLLRCACGRRAIIFRPGSEPEVIRCEQFEMPLAKGEAMQAWCLACWPQRRLGAADDLKGNRHARPAAGAPGKEAQAPRA